MGVILGRAKILAVVLLAHVLCVKSIGDHLIPQQTLCTGASFSCALHNAKLQCWGNSKEPMIYSDFTNPRQISCGFTSVCVLDNEGVSCWKQFGDFGAMKVPTFINPKQISTGWGHRCVLDDKGVHCWHPDPGSALPGVDITPPTLKNPRQVATTMDASCALTDDGVRCWGIGPPEPLTKLGENAQIFGGSTSSYMCVLDGGGVKCWATYLNKIKWWDVPMLHQPKHLGIGFTGAFAVDSNGIQWWESSGNSVPGTDLQKEMPSDIEYPTEISVELAHACAVTAAGVRCWGDNTYGQTNVPPELSRKHDLSDLDVFSVSSVFKKLVQK